MVLTLLLSAFLVSGCRDTTPAAVTTSLFGGADIGWLQITIAMDESVSPLLKLAPQRTEDAAVQAAALQVGAVVDAELDQLRAVYAESKPPSVNPYDGRSMTGIVTKTELSRVAKLSGKAFDNALLADLKDFLQSGQDLADNEQKSGLESQTRDLALTVSRTRAEALSALPG